MLDWADSHPLKTIFIVSAAVIVVALFLVYATAIASCRSTGRISDLAVTFDIWAGCFVEHEGGFIPLDRWIYLTGGTR